MTTTIVVFLTTANKLLQRSKTCTVCKLNGKTCLISRSVYCNSNNQYYFNINFYCHAKKK